MPPVRMRGDGRKAKDPKKVLLRLLGYMKQYRVTLIAVVFCIILTAVALRRFQPVSGQGGG